MVGYFFPAKGVNIFLTGVGGGGECSVCGPAGGVVGFNIETCFLQATVSNNPGHPVHTYVPTILLKLKM